MADLETFRAETRAGWTPTHPSRSAASAVSELDGNWGGRKRHVRPTRTQGLARAWRPSSGWTAPTWPTEYGGGGLSNAEAKVLAQEMARAAAAPAAGRLRPRR